jgi:glycosyltransferase involved in cell wall biosynthesis
MKISVVMPVYNEAETIEEIVARVQAIPLELEKEIVIVDDASKDGTRERLQKISQAGNIKVFYHDRNQGKGAALRTGFNHAIIPSCSSRFSMAALTSSMVRGF